MGALEDVMSSTVAAPANLTTSIILSKVGTSLCCLISVCATAWLLRRLHRLSSVLEQQKMKKEFPLLGRQLWYLSAGDLTYGFSEIIIAIIALVSRSESNGFQNFPQAARDGMCGGVVVISLLGLYSSMLVEIQLALAFAALIFKWKMAVIYLRRSLRFGPLLAAAIAIIEVIVYEVRHKKDHGCLINNGSNRDWFFFILAGLAMGLCTIIYVSGALRTHCTSGHAVTSRAWTRAHLYILIEICCVSPNYIYRLVAPDHKSAYVQTEAIFIMSFMMFCLFDLQGACRSIMYVYMSRDTRTLLRRARRVNQGQDGVAETAVDTQSPGDPINPNAAEARPPARQKRAARLSTTGNAVNFAEEADVVEVSMIGRQARLRAETEIRMLRAFEADDSSAGEEEYDDEQDQEQSNRRQDSSLSSRDVLSFDGFGPASPPSAPPARSSSATENGYVPPPIDSKQRRSDSRERSSKQLSSSPPTDSKQRRSSSKDKSSRHLSSSPQQWQAATVATSSAEDEWNSARLD